MTDAEKAAIVADLDRLIREVVPGVSTVEKYGGTLYTLKPEEKEGQFCGVFEMKAHVHLAFSRGAELSDPDGLLLGAGKYRRHINYHSADALDPVPIRPLLLAAAAR
ncbi:MAG: DUF1801 domain-containing protein [Planctomycetota bacterium]